MTFIEDKFVSAAKKEHQDRESLALESEPAKAAGGGRPRARLKVVSRVGAQI